MRWNAGNLDLSVPGLSLNSPKNQILRIVLARLVKVGQFGTDFALAREMQQKLLAAARPGRDSLRRAHTRLHPVRQVICPERA